MKLYDLYFQEFVEYMHDQLLKCEYIMQMNKAGSIRTQKSEGRQDCYMWVYKTGRSEEKKMVLYQLKTTENMNRASDYLEGFNGVIQSDGYQAYANIKRCKNMGCFAHLRRNW